MVFTILMLIILGATIAFSVRDGIWTNLIRFFNLLFAALIATNYFESLAQALENYASSFTYLVDFISIWLLFVVSFVVMRVLTDQLSHVRVWFPAIFDKYGGVALSVVLGFTMLSFSVFALHTAPLQPNYWGMQTPATPVGAGWGMFVKMESNGALGCDNSFGDTGDFYKRYHTRRQNLEQFVGKNKALRVPERDINQHKRK